MARQNEQIRGNPFVSGDKSEIENAIHEGHQVFRVWAKAHIEVEEISGEEEQSIWQHITLYFSHRNFDHLTTDEFEEQYAVQLIDDYYDGQRENGTHYHHSEDLLIRSVDKYDNNNINDIPLRGKTYRHRLLDNINTTELVLRDGKCFFDYLCYMICKHANFKGYTPKQLKTELKGKTALTINDVITWIKKGTNKTNYDKNVSIYCWWENSNLAYKFVSHNPRNNTVMLNFMVCDDHVYPLINSDVLKPKQLCKISSLTHTMNDLHKEVNTDFNFHFNNYYFVSYDELFENMDDIIDGTFKSEYEALVFELYDDDENINMITMGNRIMKKTKYKLSCINFKRQMFRHPTSKNHQFYIFCDEFRERKEACDILCEKTKLINLKFDNQSWGEISLTLMDYYMDNNENWKSAFHPQLQKLVDDMCCKPLVQGLCKLDEKEKIVVWDLNKAYLMAIYELLATEKIPIYHLGDDMVEFDKDEHMWYRKKHKKIILKPYLFYIPAIIILPYGLLIREGIYPHVLIQHLLDEGHITTKDIHYCIPAFDCLKGSDLAEFVKTLWELLKDKPKYAKMILNVAVGLFNTKYKSKTDNVQISTKAPFSIAFINWLNEFYDSKQLTWNIQSDADDSFDWIRYKTKQRQAKDNGVINQYIVGASIVRTLKMLKTKWQDGMKLVGFKTDAVYLHIPSDLDVKDDITKCSLFYGHTDVFRNAHPSRYDEFVYDAKIHFPDQDEYNNKYYDKHYNKTTPDTLDDLKKYPYKLEFDKKPPKYDEVRINALKETLGVVRCKDDMLVKPLRRITNEVELLRCIRGISKKIDKTDDKTKLEKIAEKCKNFAILIYGTAGSGKTTLGIEIQSCLTKLALKLNKNILITAFQRTTVNSWSNRVQQFNKKCETSDRGDDVIGFCHYMNWDKYYGSMYKDGLMIRERSVSIAPKKIFAIFIDEFFQMPRRCLLDLCYVVRQNPNIIIIPIGDPQQMPAIDSPVYDWSERALMHNFVKCKLQKQYIPESGRFTVEVLQLVKWLEENTIESIKKFKNFLLQTNDDGSYKYENNDLHATPYHLCHHRRKKISTNVANINKVVCPELQAGGEIICEKDFETEAVNENDKVVVDSENKPLKVKILVGERCKIVKMSADKKSCKLEVATCTDKTFGWFPIRYKNYTHLVPGNASTTFREQGRELTKPYTIHDVSETKKQELIVAISRGKHKTDILFRFSNLEKLEKIRTFPCVYKNQSKGFLRAIPSRWENYKQQYKPARSKLAKGFLYHIVDDDDSHYIGETTATVQNDTQQKTFDRRWKEHTNPKGKSQVLKMKNPVMKPYYDGEYFMFGTYKQRQRIEKKHIRKTLYECNDNKKICYNKDGTEKIIVSQKQFQKTIIALDTQRDLLFADLEIREEKNKNAKIYVVYNAHFADWLGLKSKHKVKKKDYSELKKLIDKYVVDQCCVLKRDRKK